MCTNFHRDRTNNTDLFILFFFGRGGTIEERVGKNTAQKSVGTIDEQSFGHL